MKTIIVIIIVFGTAAVYSPDSIIPKYSIDKTSQVEYRVYDSKQIAVPKYIYKPDPLAESSIVYEAGKPDLALNRIEKREAEY